MEKAGRQGISPVDRPSPPCGRHWVRTSDLFRVREARYRCASRPRWRRDLNPCIRICSPLPRLSATPPNKELPHHEGLWPIDGALASPSGRRDSNPRPSPWQGDALPTEPRPHAFRGEPVKRVDNHSGREPAGQIWVPPPHFHCPTTAFGSPPRSPQAGLRTRPSAIASRFSPQDRHPHRINHRAAAATRHATPTTGIAVEARDRKRTYGTSRFSAHRAASHPCPQARTRHAMHREPRTALRTQHGS